MISRGWVCSRTIFFGGLSLDVDIACILTAAVSHTVPATLKKQDLHYLTIHRQLLQSVHRDIKFSMDDGSDYFEIIAQTAQKVQRLVSTLHNKVFREDLVYRERDCKDLRKGAKEYPVLVDSKTRRLIMGASALAKNRESIISHHKVHQY